MKWDQVGQVGHGISTALVYYKGFKNYFRHMWYVSIFLFFSFAYVGFDSHLKAKEALEENQDKAPMIVRRDIKPWGML